MNLKIKDILDCTNGKLLIGDIEKECENFSKDTRTVKKGDTYIGIKGQNFDGNIFWEEAFNKGADTVIINEIDINEVLIKKYRTENKNIILVKDSREALKQIATKKRNLYKDLIVIGVTGSVGKTSTKDMIANVLGQKYRTLKTEGNNNNDIGLPFTILKLKEHEAAVIEMGMNHLGEIRELTKIAKPTLAVITNIGSSHIGNLGSRENILKAKLEILEGMESPKIVINNDNDLLHKWYESNKENIDIYTFGIDNQSDCMAENIVRDEKNSSFVCCLNGDKFQENIPVGGDVFVLNSLCATLVANISDLNNEEIQKGIADFKLTEKRMESIHISNDITIINDSYNASYESMKSSIEYLANIKSTRKIAVLGDMFELGEYTEEFHRKVGLELVKNGIDKLFAIGNNIMFTIDAAKELGMDSSNIVHVQSNEELIELIKRSAKNGDVILFKASNGMRLFDVVEKIKTEM